MTLSVRNRHADRHVRRLPELAWAMIPGSVLALVTYTSPFLGLALGLAAVAVGMVLSKPALAGVAVGVLLCNTSLKVGGFIASNVVVALLGVLGGLYLLNRSKVDVGAALAGPAIYLVLMTPGTVFNPSSAGFSALLLQRPVLTIGSVLAGVWLAQAGAVRPLILLLYAGSVVIAIAALPSLAEGVPAYPLGLNKNYAGQLIATVFLLRLIPHQLGSQWLRIPHMGILLLGLVATESRSAYLGLIVGAIYYAIVNRTGSVFIRRVVVIGGALTGLTITYVLIQAQLSSGNQFNSAAVRPADALALLNSFGAHPFLGVGMENISSIKTVTAYGTGNVSAPSLSLQTLAEGGIFGLPAFLALVFLPFRVKLGPQAVLVRTLILTRVVEGQFDYYWSAGSTTIVWLLLGGSLAIAQQRRSEQPPQSGADQSRIAGARKARV